MKRLISLLLLLTMLVSVFAGCASDNGGDDTTNPSGNNAESDLPSAKAYLVNMYQTGGKNDVMTLTKDLDVLSVVVVGGVSYTVEWAVSITAGASDSVKIGTSSKENHVLLDINETPADEIQFTATATIKDAAGQSETASFKYKVAASATAGMTDEQIVEMAYGLAEGEIMDGSSTLTGEIKMIKTAYDASFQNITVIIQIGDLSDKRIECYRMTGAGCENLAIGDTITVTGVLKNYNGTIEFDAGCTLDNVVKGDVVEIPTDPKEIIDAAYALPTGDALPYVAVLTGKITKIDKPYDSGYQNISVVITIEGREDKPLLVYRLKGDGADALAVEDVITVSGYICNYNGTIEYTAGCTLTSVVPGKNHGTSTTPDNSTIPTTPTGIVDAAYNLAENTAMSAAVTLTGTVTKINEDYNDQYKNITVTITVKGRESKPIKCYRLKGTGVENIKIGDKITVTGIIKNYNGTVEFDLGCTLDKIEDGDIDVATDEKAIVDAAYELASGADMGYDVTLTGKIVGLVTPYDSEFGNMTVIIAVKGREAKPIECYRMKGDDVSNKLCIGDTITVTGRLKNYNGKIEFDANCKMTKYVSGGTKVPTDSKKIVDAAFALEGGTSLSYFATLTGKILTIDTEYSSQYKNITVTIEVQGSNGAKELKCYRMKGTGAENLAVGDTITVTGILKNHVHSSGDEEIEFDAGCTFTK